MPTSNLVACRGGLIAEVAPGSAAKELGLHPGDRLVAINGHPLRDALDYQFYLADDHLDLQLERDGEPLHLSTPGVDSLGAHFADAVFDGVRTCRNRCVFCFLRGLPAGMRGSLYLKDDDYRLSAAVGNFVTLTNLDDEDWARLEEQRLSPLHVSVHATEPALRRRLLGNPEAPDIVPQLRRLAALDIRVHAQVVLCPDLNDGADLDRTIGDLLSLHPGVASIAVVPVGLTRYHRLDPALRRFSPAEAERIVRQVRGWRKAARQQLGRGVLYAADELYLLAGLPLPASSAYDGFPQLANGIGLVRLLLDEWRRTRRRLRGSSVGRTAHREGSVPTATIACGVLLAPLLEQLAGELSSLIGERIAVVPVENEFFGPEVTVSGLLTGDDVQRALQGHHLGRVVVLPRAALDAEGRVFLDDRTPVELASSLGVRVEFADDVRGLLAALDAA